MATVSRVTPSGWVQYDDGATISRVTPSGWLQFVAAAAASGKGALVDGRLANSRLPVGGRLVG